MYRNTYAQIDLQAYKANIRALAKQANNSVMAVVKADAYGHGAVEISKAAVEAGATALAIALPEEAIELRQAGIALPIMVLGRANAAQAELSVELGLEQCVFFGEDILHMQQYAHKHGKIAHVQMKIDTGMNRIGLRDKEELTMLLRVAEECPNVCIGGVFTHFSCADEADKAFTQEQYKKLDDMVRQIRAAGYQPKVHASNSAACIELPEYALDYSRCGISTYGYYPSEEVSRQTVQLRPVMQVFSDISQIKEVPAGTPIGYNATYVTQKPTRIATVQIGYGDGYPRLLSNVGKMLVCGKHKSEYASIVGRVCMDQTMIDVTGIDWLAAGDAVVVLGGSSEKGIWADEIAKHCETISYEVLLSWTKRVPRVYI